MSVEVWDPFPSEREWAEFGRPRNVGSDEIVDLGGAVDSGRVVDFSDVVDSGGVVDFSDVADSGGIAGISGVADFAEVLGWPEMPAEGWVGDVLARIPLLSASDSELLDVAAAWDQLAAWVAGNQARVIGEFASRRCGDPAGAGGLSEGELAEIGRVGAVIDSEVDRSAAEELSLALKVAPVTARHKMRLAVDLSTRLPKALGRMCDGQLSWSKAKTLSDQAENLTKKQCAELQNRVLDWSIGRTAGQFRDRIRREIGRIDSDALRRRAAKAVEERRAQLIPERDGMGILSLRLPGADAVAAYNWLDEQAAQSRPPGISGPWISCAQMRSSTWCASARPRWRASR